ncbi:MAG: hypothetical protein HY080_05675 [Gammaproteobacteria bacterium]|nr:hypothetical protein [Gammaproteobacteria bacterium]
MTPPRTIQPKLTLIIVLSMLSVLVYADRDDHDRGFRHQEHVQPPNNFHFDRRYHHDHDYPRYGYRVDRLPERHYRLHYHDSDYYYYGGVWYEPSGPDFVVVTPPAGIVVASLPPFYTTLWVGGTPYYYANDIYYIWQPDRNGYVVTDPPAGISQTEPPFLADEIYIYPKNGQTEQQQADDRYECHRWSVKQTGYDPTQPPTNLAATELNRKREGYQRAMRACLEGRNYSVR